MRNTTLRPWTWRLASWGSGRRAAALTVLGVGLLSRGNLLAQATVTTLGGGSIGAPYSGYVDGNTLTAAKFDMPSGMALDPSGTVLFIADYANNAIRMVAPIGNTTGSNAASSITSTFANAASSGGFGGIRHPLAVAVDAATNVFVLNQGGGNGEVLHLGGVAMNSGVVEVYPALASGLINATAMTMDGVDNLYVTVNGNQVIRVTTNGVITTLGTISQAGTSLQGIAMLDNGLLALTDSGNNGIWLLNPVSGAVSEFTGFHGAADVLGTASQAAFNSPASLSKAGGGILVVADRGNNKVKLVDASGTVSLLYGVSSNLWITGSGAFPGWRDGVGTATKGSAESRLPYGVLVGTDGSVYATEDYYHVLRHVTATGLAAPGQSYPQTFNNPAAIAVDPTGSSLYIADTANNAVELLNLGNNQTTTFLTGANGVSHPASVLVGTNSNIYVLNQNTGTNGCLLEFDPYGNFLGTNLTGLIQPTALTMDGNGNLFITELAGSIKMLFPSGAANTIVTLNTNIITLKTNVQLQGIAAFDDGVLAVSDSANQVIWTINPITKLVAKLTGQLGSNGATLGASNFAKLSYPHQLARAGNNQLVIADYGNNRLVIATRSGAITNVLASTNSLLWLGRPTDPAAGATVTMAGPAGVAVSSSGQVFDSEPTNQLIRGLTATVTAPPAPPPTVNVPYFARPQGIAFDSVDNYLFIADSVNNAVQLLDLNDNFTSTFLSEFNGLLNPASVLLDTNDNVYVLNQGTPGNGFILEFDIYGNEYGAVVTGLNQPTAFTMDAYGTLFVTEQAGNIRAFGPSAATLVATITNANANVSLQGIALFDDGTIAVSDASSNVLWTVNPITKLVSRLTGQLGTSGITVGASNFARLSQPRQLVRVGGNQIIAADYGNNRLVLVQRDGTVVTNSTTYHLNSSVADIWFGQPGDPIANGNPKFVPMISPVGVAAGNGGEIFASETYYGDIRGLTGTGITGPTSNPGVPLPYFAYPGGIALNNEGTMLYVTEPTNHTLSTLNLANNQITVFLNSSNGLAYPVDVAVDSSDNLYVLNQGTGTNGSILEFDRFGNLIQTNAAGLPLPSAMTFDISGNILVAERAGAVQEFSPAASNSVTTLATVISTNNVQLQGIALFDDGTIVLSDTGNHVLWQLDPVTKAASLFTGQLDSPGATFGSASFAQLNQPHQLKLAANNLLVAADSGNNRLVLIARSGAITNALNSTNALVWFGLPGDPAAAGSAEFVPMVSPIGVAIAAAGDVFDSESYFHDIREVLGTSVTQPGSGGSTGGTGTNAVVVPPPIISPNSGYYPMGQTIVVQSPAPQVFYTTDGTDPTTNSLPVSLTNNVGYIQWYNSTNDLTSLRLRAFLQGTNFSAVVAGQPVAAATIGVPSDFNLNLYAGIGSTVVIPVVCNLATGQHIESYQLRLEIAPLNSPNTPVISPLSIIPTNDFIPLVTAAESGFIASNTVETYSLGVTNGLTLFAVGAGTHILFENYAVVALLEVHIPYVANQGDTYAFNVLYPSATADAYNTPVPLTAMSTTTITVTNIPYTVGDSASTLRTWYNAGTFGDDNLDNSDVNQAFYAASGLRVPYFFSDVFNAMDAYPPDAVGFVGGDGQIRFLDWITILQRSLRFDPNNWAREWSAGGDLINFSTNLVVSHAQTTSAPKATPKGSPPWPWYRQVLLGADSVGQVAPNTTVSVPIYAQLADGSSLSGLQFRAVVTPQNGAPALTTAPQLDPATGVASPLFTQSFKPGETAFGWSLDSFNYLSRSSNFLGWITFMVPSNAVAGQTYQVSLLNADGAPDATKQYDFETRSATVAINAWAPPPTICSDEWKLHFFGSTTNPAAADNADPDGDGLPNWMEFLAGTDPTSALSKLQLTGAVATVGKSQTQMQLNWLSAPGRAYEVQWSANLNNPGGWNTLSTISGTGYATNCPDLNPSASTRYYRLYVLP